MSFPVTYHNAMTEIANLAMDRSEPGYVRVRALTKLVSELSPLNERHAEVKRELGIELPADQGAENDVLSETMAYMKGVRDAQAAYAQCECPCTCQPDAAEADDEETSEEDDDPL